MLTFSPYCIRSAVAPVIVILVGLAHVALVRPAPAHAQGTDHVLKEYVTRPDDSYDWRVRQRTRLGQSDCIELTLTSQTWQGIVWKHRLFLIVPDGVKDRSDALLVIEGGRWDKSDAQPLPAGADPAYPEEAALLAAFARQLGSPVAVLLNVPRQPIFDGRTEDEIIAYTFDKFLETGDTDWPLLLPMVKSAVRAMDAVQAFALEDRSLRIDGFTVTGASKRGWTTWLTAAVDDRVIALVPMVIDMLNMEAQLPHQYASWGGYSGRIHDYTDIDLPHRIQSPRGERLVQIVDPYSYRAQLTQPKLMLLGTNDGYWTLDALNLYWDGLKGPKYVLYVPNADHDLAMDWRRIFGAVRAIQRHAAGLEAMPPLTWRYDENDAGVTLTVEPGEAALRVLMWSAVSPTRDFRHARWLSKPLAADAAGHYVAELPPPTQGYIAAFAEVVYPRAVLPLSLSTTIRIIGAAGHEQR